MEKADKEAGESHLYIDDRGHVLQLDLLGQHSFHPLAPGPGEWCKVGHSLWLFCATHCRVHVGVLFGAVFHSVVFGLVLFCVAFFCVAVWLCCSGICCCVLCAFIMCGCVMCGCVMCGCVLYGCVLFSRVLLDSILSVWCNFM